MITYKTSTGVTLTVPDTVPRSQFMQYCQERINELYSKYGEYRIYDYTKNYISIVNVDNPKETINFYLVKV